MGLTRIAVILLIAGIAAITCAIALLFGPAWGLLVVGVGAVSLALEELHDHPA